MVMLRLTQTLRMNGQARPLFLILSLGLLPPLQASCDELKILSRKEWKARPAKQTEVIEARVEEALVPRGSALSELGSLAPQNSQSAHQGDFACRASAHVSRKKEFPAAGERQ